MLFYAAFAIFLGASVVYSSPNNATLNQRVCGTIKSPEDIVKAEHDFNTNAIVPPSDQAKTINVFFHVVSLNNTPEGGNVPDSQLHDQINVMNKAYGPAGIAWSLGGITRTINPSWFNSAGPHNQQQDDMKKALRKGGSLDLNVYTVGFRDPSSGGLLGYSTFPYDYSSNSTNDGVVIRFSCLPGGTMTYYNIGQTLTHEAGHWAGLYHTFQGGCSSPGDYVADTPEEAGPSTGCSAGRDSCPKDSGVDPVHNFMDYSFDSCMTEFTSGQEKRMKAQIATYRDNHN